MLPPPKGKTGLARIVAATGHSAHGLQAAFLHESAFRQELALAAVLVPAAFWVGSGPLQVALLIASVVAVLVVELLNSAVEAVVDKASPEQHELAKRAKDMGSAAVLLALLACAALWLAVAWQRWGG